MQKSLYDYCIERDDFQLLVQWDKEKNKELTTRGVSYGSHKKVWWKCEYGHQWEAAVYSRTTNATGCPYCTGRKSSPGIRTLATERSDLAKQWHPTRNVGLSPEDIPPGTHRKVWWICEKGHEWQAEVKSRVKGSGCPVCSNKKIVSGENDLAVTDPDIAAQWHPYKNGSLTPDSVFGGSYIRVWWMCKKGHEWKASISSRTSGGNGCPVCAGKLVVAGVNDLASGYPQLAAQWHPDKNGTLTPGQVTPFSNRKVWWCCEKGHEYYSAISHRVQMTSGCPYCSNRKVLEGYNDLATVEPLIAAQWHDELNGELTPQMVTAGSGKKVWWQCADGHVWKAVIHSRAGPQKCGCPVCAGKTKRSTVKGSIV